MATPLFIYIFIYLRQISPKSIAHAFAFTQFVAQKVQHAFTQIVIVDFVVNALHILCALYDAFSRILNDRLR